MRRLTYVAGMTLDGFIAGPGDQVDFFPVTDDLVEFLVAELPETLPSHVRAQMGVDPPNRRFDTGIQGRATYDAALQAGITSPYAHLRQYVVSRTLASRDPAVTITAEPLAEVRRLKADDGLGIWLMGGAQLAGALLPEIDELVVKLYPVTAGTGVPLFNADFAPTSFTLAGSHILPSGTAILTYARA
jgi:dihydrofolate reductase